MAGFIKNIILVSCLLIIFCCCSYNKTTGLSTFEELNKEDNLVIVDSLSLSNEDMVYWFCVDFGVKGYSSGRVGIAKNRERLTEEKSIVAISDGITGIRVGNDTLYIECIRGYLLEDSLIDNRTIKYVKVDYTGKTEDMIINRIERGKQYPLIEMPSVE